MKLIEQGLTKDEEFAQEREFFLKRSNKEQELREDLNNKIQLLEQ